MPQRAAQEALEAAALTEKGGARRRNEDAFGVLPEQALYIVSDGLGGHPAGDTASQIVVRVLPALFRSHLDRCRDGGLEAGLRHAILDLGRKMRKQSALETGIAGMGATVVAALIKDRRAVIGHMGDSRAYLYRRGSLRRLTADHSVIGILLRQGRISEEEAEGHPARGRLSRFVGMEGDVRPDVRTVEIRSGDRLLLCTDGLTGVVPDAVIETILGRFGSPEHACGALLEAATTAKAADNVTVLVVDCQMGGAQCPEK